MSDGPAMLFPLHKVFRDAACNLAGSRTLVTPCEDQGIPVGAIFSERQPGVENAALKNLFHPSDHKSGNNVRVRLLAIDFALCSIKQID